MGCGASNEAPKIKNHYAFRVRLVGALNLFNNGFGVQIPGSKTSDYNFSGKSDPYVWLDCQGIRFKSETILHEQNPVWNQDFYFNVSTRKPILKLSVFDADVVQDDQIGFAEIPLFGLLERKEREIWVPLSGSKSNGEIGISVIECYMIKVNLEQGKDVEPMDTLSGSSDCYATVQVGQQPRQQTAIKGWTLNPIWNQQFIFYVPYGIESQLEIILWDHDTIKPDDNMGWVYSKLNGVPAKELQKISSKITNARGLLEYSVVHDTFCEIPEVPPMPEEEKKKLKEKFPLSPQTCQFQVRVIGAFNLAASDNCWVSDMYSEAKAFMFHQYTEPKGTSDPFARVECEGQIYDTRHINNTLEPWWNQKMRFIARSRDTSKLRVSIIDHDLVSDEALGNVVLPINMMKPGEQTEMWSFLDKGRGEVGLQLTMDFQLKVRVVACYDLPAKDFNGMCDPFVRLTIGTQMYQTRVCRDNRSPWIEEDFRWSLGTLKNQKLFVEVRDSDFMIKKASLSDDLIGRAEMSLEGFPHGVPNEVTLELMNGKAKQGTIRLIITDEIPIPPSAFDLLAEGAKEAFDKMVSGLASTANFITTLSFADPENDKEAEVEVFDEKISPFPRYSKMDISVVGTVKQQNIKPPMYVGVSIPHQGQRFKTKEVGSANTKFEDPPFEFRVPTKLTSAIELSVFETAKAPYTGAWSDKPQNRATKFFRSFNNDEGLIRGSPPDDEWLDLENGGKIVIRVFEHFRWYVKVLSGEGLKTTADPYVVIELEGKRQRTHTVSRDPAKDRTEGIPGKPVWNEPFFFFTKNKGTIKFLLMDDNTLKDDHLGSATFDLNDLRRGKEKEIELNLSKGGTLRVLLKEDEKMGLADRIIDAAANAAKFAGELASQVADAIGSGISAIGGALGSLF